jgi:hypothetical protein
MNFQQSPNRPLELPNNIDIPPPPPPMDYSSLQPSQPVVLDGSYFHFPSVGEMNQQYLIIIIFILLIIILFNIFHVNVIQFVFHIIKSMVHFFTPFTNNLSIATGSILNETTDIVTDVTKTTIDIAGGAVYNVGDLLVAGGSSNNLYPYSQSLDTNVSNQSSWSLSPPPEEDTTSNTIQNAIVSNKVGWCLVGETAGRRGCLAVNDPYTCMSNQIYPTEQLCLNPTMSNNMFIQ